jgi:hypothetical protein
MNPSRPDPMRERAGSASPRAGGRQEWLLMGAALVAVGLFVGWSRYVEYREVDVEQRQLLGVQAQSIDAALSQDMTRIATALLGVRDDLPSWPANEVGGRGSRRLRALGNAVGGIQSMVLLDRTGRAVASSRSELLGRDEHAQGYFQQARAGNGSRQVALSLPTPGPSGALVPNLTVAVWGADGTFEGVVSATLDAVYLQGLLRSTRYAQDVWSGLADGSGVLMLHEPAAPELAGRQLDLPGSLFRRHRETAQVSSALTGDFDLIGDRRMMVLRTVQPAGVALDSALVVVVSRSLDAMFSPWRRQSLAYAALYALFALSTSTALVAMQRRQSALERAQALAKELERKSAERLALALRGADLGLWDLDVPSGTSVVSERWAAAPGGVPGFERVA